MPIAYQGFCADRLRYTKTRLTETVPIGPPRRVRVLAGHGDGLSDCDGSAEGKGHARRLAELSHGLCLLFSLEPVRPSINTNWFQTFITNDWPRFFHERVHEISRLPLLELPTADRAVRICEAYAHVFAHVHTQVRIHEASELLAAIDPAQTQASIRALARCARHDAAQRSVARHA